jgi:basic amino acid/polyamine antiporter, APA family
MNLFRKKDPVAILSEAGEGTAGAHGTSGLKRALGVMDLTALGIAAIIGAGIFSTIGNASAAGGPAVTLLFVFTAVACAFSALCYAQFASTLPIAGSAYTYAYAAFGELIAWLLGWSLILEYAVGNMVVAISWSGYFAELLKVFGLQIPGWLSVDPSTAQAGHQVVTAGLASGKSLADFSTHDLQAYNAWLSAPRIGELPLIGDVPALLIVVLITWLVYIGIKESKNASNLLVGLKLLVVLVVIGLGAFFIDPANWSPFAPNGFAGVMSGVSAVFFAYIGFDALSTTAEECKNPQRDIPYAMMNALIICTLLYVLIALVLTGMAPYATLAVDDPLAYVFANSSMDPFWRRVVTSGIAVSAVVAMSSVLLVFQMGQPRIWMAMSRDGLLPRVFGRIHPRFGTPGFSTILTGLIVGIPSMFLNLQLVTDLTSIGTLFAFVVVCAGVLVMPRMDGTELVQGRKPFRVPYVNGKLYIALGLLFTLLLTALLSPQSYRALFLPESWGQFWSSVPRLLFVITAIGLTVVTWMRSFSLIPVLGILSCLYLMTELHVQNWVNFSFWLALGVAVYFGYSYRHSKLNGPALDAK